MPAFSETADGKYLLDINKPYDFVLRYYNLDPKTKVIFE